MTGKKIRNALGKGPVPQRLLETQRLCVELLNERQMDTDEERTSFWTFLSSVFKHIGLRLWGMQLLILVVVCASVLSLPDVFKSVPFFTPLFILASIPSMFQNQAYGMCEMEAVTRASGAQIVLAKLVMAGAADLICLSVTLVSAGIASDFSVNMSQMIVYAFVPLLGCMFVTLGYIRKCKRNAPIKCVVVCLSASICTGGLARWIPAVYELSAIWLWIITFVVFTVFFVRELYFLIGARKAGGMYGIIA